MPHVTRTSLINIKKRNFKDIMMSENTRAERSKNSSPDGKKFYRDTYSKPLKPKKGPMTFNTRSININSMTKAKAQEMTSPILIKNLKMTLCFCNKQNFP